MICYFSNVGDLFMKQIMYDFINEVVNNNLTTKMLLEIFGYSDLKDYNYIFRVSCDDNSVIVDIYDNVSINRFNRFCFSFNILFDNFNRVENENVFVTYISVYNINNLSNNIFRFAYLFSLDVGNMLEYANTFLDKSFISLLENIIKKSI